MDGSSRDTATRARTTGLARLPWWVGMATGLVCVVLAIRDARRGVGDGWLGLWNFDGAGLVELGALDLIAVVGCGEFWRLGSSWLLHGSWLHWILNVVSLGSLWPWCEEAGSHRRAVAVFGVGVVASGMAALASGEGALIVGMSGGLFALGGWRWSAPKALPRRLRRELGALLFGCLGLGVALPLVWPGGPRFANVGHAAGMWSGVAMVGVFAGWSRVRGARRVDVGVRDLRRWWLVCTVGLCAMVFFGLKTRKTSFNLTLGESWLAAGELGEAQVALEAAVDADPEDPTATNALAYVLAVQNTQLERAERLSRASLAAEPENAAFLDTLGWIRCLAGAPTEGRARLETAQARRESEDWVLETHLERCEGAVERPFVELYAPGFRPRQCGDSAHGSVFSTASSAD